MRETMKRALTPFGSPSSSSSSPAYSSSSSFKSAIIVFRGGLKMNLKQSTIAYLNIILVTFLALCMFRLVGNARWGVTLICGWRHGGGLAVFWIYRACLTTSQIGSAQSSVKFNSVARVDVSAQ
ncbi:hypothetical protein F5888DRAFT_158549 [Russula emetica]|nr:hypothetical protein F5888DRAFT_158549 [Russula emetica]